MRLCAEKRGGAEKRAVCGAVQRSAAVCREAGLCAEKCWGQGSADGEAQAAYKAYGRRSNRAVRARCRCPMRPPMF